MTNKKVQHDIYLSTGITKKSEQYHIILPIILGDIIKTTPNRQEKVLCIIVLVKWMYSVYVPFQTWDNAYFYVHK